MNSYPVAVLNNVASYVFILAFIAFLVFAVHSIIYYKHAFIIMVIAGIIGAITPNKEEREEFFKAKGSAVQQPTSEVQKPLK